MRAGAGRVRTDAEQPIFDSHTLHNFRSHPDFNPQTPDFGLETDPETNRIRTDQDPGKKTPKRPLELETPPESTLFGRLQD